jgi:hypothetical protein
MSLFSTPSFFKGSGFSVVAFLFATGLIVAVYFLPVTPRAAELSFSSMSPLGEKGGSVIPASCESGYEHYAGECTSPPANPTGLTGSCTNGVITVSYTPVSGATYYLLRIDDTSVSGTWGASPYPTCTNNVPSTSGEVCTTNTFTGTSFTFTGQVGHTYNWWVHSGNGNGYNPAASGGTPFTCAYSGPTTICSPSTMCTASGNDPSCVVNSAVNLNTGLVSRWTFDASSGGTAADSVGSNSGTLNNFADPALITSGWAIDNKPGGVAIAFDGIDDRVSFPLLTWSAAGGPVTVVYWNKVDTAEMQNSTLFGFDNAGNSAQRFQSHSPYGNNYLYWDYGDIGVSNTNGRASVVYAPTYLNKWVHVALTSQGNGGSAKAIYLNGVSITDPSFSGSISDGPDTLYTGFTIGNRTGGTSYHKGKVDDFRIYNRVLSTNEINTLMSGGQVTNGLYAYWPFNEGAGTVTTDASGGGNNGTLTNFNSTATSGWVTDSTVGGTVLSFDGVDDYVTVPYSSNLNLTTGVTLSAWVKTTQTNRGDIITRYKPASPFPGYGLVMDPGTPGCTTPGTIGMWVGDMTNYYVCSTAVVNDGNWHLVTGTYDGTTVKIYIDGNGAPNVSGTRTNSLNETVTPLYIGNNSNLDRPFAGSIDNARVYNRVLTDAEVTSMFNGSPTATGLVGYWAFNNGNGSLATDSSGNSNTGTLVNFGSFPTVISGWSSDAKVGSGSLAFDGVDDYLTLGSGTNLDFGANTAFTISSWVKTNDSYGCIVCFRNSSNTTPLVNLMVGYDGVTTDAGKFLAIVRDTGGVLTDKNSGTNIANGAYHHVVLTRTTSGVLEVFVDGVSKGVAGVSVPGAISTGGVGNNRAIGSERAWVAGGNGTADQRYLSGIIDDTRVYSRALSGSEVALLYANTSPSNCTTSGNTCLQETGNSCSVNTCTPNTVCATSPANSCGMTNNLLWSSSCVCGPAAPITPAESSCPAPSIVFNPELSYGGIGDATGKKIKKGNTCTFSWTTTNATTCTLAGPGLSLSGPNATTSRVTSPALSIKSVYTLTCQSGSAQISNDSFTCSIAPDYREQ